jgi:hypothetical protein
MSHSIRPVLLWFDVLQYLIFHQVISLHSSLALEHSLPFFNRRFILIVFLDRASLSYPHLWLIIAWLIVLAFIHPYNYWLWLFYNILVVRFLFRTKLNLRSVICWSFYMLWYVFIKGWTLLLLLLQSLKSWFFKIFFYLFYFNNMDMLNSSIVNNLLIV